MKRNDRVTLDGHPATVAADVRPSDPHIAIELPDASIVYHVDQGDIFKAHKVLGEKFCLSGGVSNVLLGCGTPEAVRQQCKKIIDGVAGDGGLPAVMDVFADARLVQPGQAVHCGLVHGGQRRGGETPP